MYKPIDNVPKQSRTTESDAVACQKRCFNVEGCSYFSFYDDGGCHLSSHAASRKTEVGVTAGLKVCQAGKFTLLHLIYKVVLYIIIYREVYICISLYMTK